MTPRWAFFLDLLLNNRYIFFTTSGQRCASQCVREMRVSPFGAELQDLASNQPELLHHANKEEY